MGLFSRTKTSVGLDIGSGLIKLAVISHGSGDPVLTKVAFAPLVDDAIVEGEVMDPGIVSNAVKALFASAGLKPRHVVTAVGGRDVIIKKIPMDRMKESEAREVIRWEAEQHVPFDMDNVELDSRFWIPMARPADDRPPGGGQRELIDNKIALLAEVASVPA